jgi:hypothetical protein
MKHPALCFDRYHVSRKSVLVAAAIMWCSIGVSSRSMAQGLRPARQDILEMYVFNGVDEATFKKQLNDQAKLVVDRLTKITAIDEAQQQKLKLAATGDIRRFYRELEIARDKTKEIDIQDQEEMQKAWQVVMPIQQRMNEGILNESSLFEKLLEAVLTVEQRSAYDKYLREREHALYASIASATIADMEKSLPLRSKQRAELRELLESSPFPKKVPNHFLYIVGWVLLGRLDEAKTAVILDEQQQKTFKQLTQQYENQAGNFTW